MYVRYMQEVLQRVVSEGHEMGSHTAQHLDLTTLSAAGVEEQLVWAIGNISTVTNSTIVPVSGWQDCFSYQLGLKYWL